MPKSPDQEPAAMRFSAGAGRYGATLTVSSVNSELSGAVKVLDMQHGFDADEPETDEVTISFVNMKTNGELAAWLMNTALPKLVGSDFFHRRPANNILEMQETISGLVRQLLDLRDRMADVHH